MPNLYVILLGESGSGKGQAIKNLEQLIKVPAPSRRKDGEIGYVIRPELNCFNGTITASYLSKFLSAKQKVYLLMPELSQSLTNRTLTEWFIRTMCELSSPKISHIDGTVKHGSIEIKGQVINWMAGSTKKWLVEAVPQSSIQGGFIGRSVVVEGDRKGDRVWEPVPPPDREAVMKYLREVIQWYLTLRGQFKYTDKAKTVQRTWYMTRPDESDDALRPSWLREDDLVFKLSMLFSLSDLAQLDDKSLVVKSEHVRAAINTISDLWKPIGKLAEASETSQHPMAKGLQLTRDIIMQFPLSEHKFIRKYDLSRRLSTRGYLERQRAEFIQELVHKTGEVEVLQSERGGVRYAWKGEIEKEKE